ncbi:MAG: metal ABC transporter ATP-binding protein [bacterium]|nr:metal ABC transporter ATP-binding protein [bacterium]MDD5756746.1 metal ABC transporter ATP-binding protein [bacterium]
MRKDIIRFANVSFGYGRKTILSSLKFDIDENDFIGIIGANGSGKTTLLKGILGLLKPAAGLLLKRSGLKFGYVPQQNAIDDIFPLSATDIVVMGLYPDLPFFKRPNCLHRGQALKALEITGLSDHAFTLYRDLSGGLKQRVLIARAIVSNPGVLVLDEPTNNLDIASEKAIMETIKDLHQERGIAVIMVSHLLNVVVNYVHRIAFLDSSKITVFSSADALTQESLWQMYHANLSINEVKGRKIVLAD